MEQYHRTKLETLIVEYLAESLMVFLSNNLLKLVKLQCNVISGTAFHGLKIPSLKAFSIMNLYPTSLKQSGWKAIVKGMPNVESLSVKTIHGDRTMNDMVFHTITKGWEKVLWPLNTSSLILEQLHEAENSRNQRTGVRIISIKEGRHLKRFYAR